MEQNEQLLILVDDRIRQGRKNQNIRFLVLDNPVFIVSEQE
jgi:hypothetical protein